MIALTECLVLLVIGGGVIAGLVAVIIAVTKSNKPVPRFDRGGLIAPPPPPPAPERMKVMRMFTEGYVTVREGDAEHDESLPTSPLGHGHFPTAICAAPGGEVYLTGKLYTGKPGPDTGVVYRRIGGAWELVHTTAERTFHGIFCDGGKLYVSAVGGWLLFDGATWKFNALPYESVVYVWLEDGKLLGAGWDGKRAWDLSGATPVEIAARQATERASKSCELGHLRFTARDRSREIGEATLSAEETKQIQGELKQVEAALRHQRG